MRVVYHDPQGWSSTRHSSSPGTESSILAEKEDSDSGYILLFLKELDSKSFSPEKAFKLLLCCTYADIFLLSPATIDGGHPSMFEYNINLQGSLYTAISEVLDKIGGNGTLNGSLYEAIKDYNSLSHVKGMRQMFPGREIAMSDLFPVIQGILNESRGKEPNFPKAYIGCLNERIPQCRVSLMVDDNDDYNNGRHGWVELTLIPQHWTAYNEYYRETDEYHAAEIKWQWHYASAGRKWVGKGWNSCRVEKWGPWKAGEPVSVRARISSLIKNLEDTFFYYLLRTLSFAATAGTTAGRTAGSNEDEVAILMRGSQWDDHFVPYRLWPQPLIDSFAADGVPWQVQIL